MMNTIKKLKKYAVIVPAIAYLMISGCQKERDIDDIYYKDYSNSDKTETVDSKSSNKIKSRSKRSKKEASTDTYSRPKVAYECLEKSKYVGKYEHVCTDPKVHKNNKTETYSEQLIGISDDKRYAFLIENNPAYVASNKIKFVPVKKGTIEDKFGIDENEVYKIFFVVTGRDKKTGECVEEEGADISDNLEEVIVRVFTPKKGEEDSYWQVASVDKDGNPVNNYSGKRTKDKSSKKSGRNIDIHNENTIIYHDTHCDNCNEEDKQKEPAPEKKQEQPSGVSLKADLPSLVDNGWNYVSLNWKELYNVDGLPDEFYVVVCSGGTDNNGNIKVKCTEDRVISDNSDKYKITFTLTNPQKGIYEGFVPDVPGTDEATHTITGYKLGGKVHGNMPQKQGKTKQKSARNQP